MYYRGNFYLNGLGDPNKAIDEFEKVLAQDPNFTLARYDLAAAYNVLGMEDEAIRQYEKTIKLQPQLSRRLCLISGGYYFRSGKVEQAKEYV